MTFTSPYFWLFLLGAVCCYYGTPSSWRWLMLLLMSYLFYWWQSPYLTLILMAITLVSYLGGIGVANAKTEQRSRAVFWGSLGVCIFMLVLLKYGTAGFLPGFSFLGAMAIVGVSYYVFQAISYLTDIRLGLLEPEKHVGYYALSLSFFPKLLQGPIERGGDILPQLHANLPFDYQAARSGLLLFAWGLFQKVVIADRLGMYVDAVYNDLQVYTGVPLILATYGFAGQIYFDFAGYTNMAIGSAKLFNITLTPNFNQPYRATSIAEFWRRWHISFSRWIFDYIFKPFQMAWRDAGAVGTSLALLITFLVSGLWHGISSGFVIWGVLHGLYMVCGVIYRPWRKKLHELFGFSNSLLLKIWQIFFTFHLVCIAWVFFRANNLSDALYLFKHLLPGEGSSIKGFLMIKGDREFYITTLLLVGLAVTPFTPSLLAIHLKKLLEGPWRWLCYTMVVIAILVLGIFHQGAFLYGRF